MRFGIDIGIDANADRRPLARLSRHGIEVIELACRFDVEAMDAQFEPTVHFRDGLSDAGKNDLAGVAAGRDDSRELAAGYDVEAASQTRQQVQQREVGVGFHRVTHEVWRIAEGGVELAERAFQRGA